MAEQVMIKQELDTPKQHKDEQIMIEEKVIPKQVMDEQVMAEQALNQCSAILFNSLDVSKISAVLKKNGLITDFEEEKLLLPHTSHRDKIAFLLDMLPRKGGQWWDEFIKCLNETSKGTGHGKIAKELEGGKEDIKNGTEEILSVQLDGSSCHKEAMKLNERPAFKTLSRIIGHLEGHWKELAYQLLEREDIVKTIQLSSKPNNDKCHDMLTKWLEVDPSASYSQLIKALEECELFFVAEKIKYKVLRSTPTRLALSSKVLSQQPEMWQLNKIVIPQIKPHWKDLAYSLRFDIATIRLIKENHQLDPKKCCQEMFEYWITDKGIGPKTWKKLLKEIGEIPELAEGLNDIREQLASLKH